MGNDFIEHCKQSYAIAEAAGDEAGMKFAIAMTNAYLDTVEWLKKGKRANGENHNQMQTR